MIELEITLWAYQINLSTSMSIFWTLGFLSWGNSAAGKKTHKQTNNSPLNQTNKPINQNKNPNKKTGLWAFGAYISVSRFYFESLRKQDTNVDFLVHPCSLNRRTFPNPKNYTSKVHSLKDFWEEIFEAVSDDTFSLKVTWLVIIRL